MAANQSQSMATTKAGLEAPVAQATLRYHRGSAQKARLVIDQIRGRGVNDALGLLHFSPKSASRAIEKLLKSAVANASQGGEKIDIDTLYVGEAYVGPGPSFRRARGRAFGRAFRILHRTCHITVRLKAKAMAAPPVSRRAGAAAAEAGHEHDIEKGADKPAKSSPRGTRGGAGRAKAPAKTRKKP